MADNLDPDTVAQFQEAMRQATEAAKELPLAMNATIEAINKATGSLKKNTQATDADTAAEEKAAATTKAKTALEEAEEEAIKKILKAQALQEAALNTAKNSLVSFGDALLSGTRGFGKYNQAMQSAGDAAYDFGKSLGPLGAVLGGIVKGATMVGSAMMKQADDTLKATDELSKMGTAGAFSAEQVRKMGTGLGLASDQLDKFTKPVKSLGSSLISLGGNAADGAAKFAELAKVTSEQRQAYQRLGISQEELIQNTADYINLQTQQGRQITDQMKRDGSLRIAAREYTDNLLELAALTGKDIDTVKKKNELAQSEIETAIQNNLLDIEINRLRKLDTAESRARANQLEQERKARDKLLQRVENEVGDPALRKGLAKFLATGAITEEVAALKRIGVPIEDFAAKIKQGVDVQDEFMDSLSKNGDAMLANLDKATLFDENTRKAFGVTAETTAYMAKARDRDEQSQREQVRARIGRMKDEKEAHDPAQVARNKLTEAEINAKVALDDMVASMNPLLNGFDGLSTATKALIIAAGAATVALTAMAVAAGKNAISGKIENLAEGTTASTKPSRRAGLKGFGMGAVTAVGAGLAAEALGTETKMGAGADILGTAAGMAGTGALVGSAIPVVGTAIGAAAGGVLGTGYGLYKNWATLFGGKQKDENLPVAREQEKMVDAREKYALEQQVLDRNISDAEKKSAERKLRLIQKQEAQQLYEESLLEIKNASDDLEKEAAIAKSYRAQEQLASLKEQEGLALLERAATEAQKKEARDMIHQARLHDIFNQEKRAKYDLENAVNDEQKKLAQERIDALKEAHKKELDEINKTEAKPAAQAGQATQSGSASGRLISVTDVPAYAEGGLIPKGEFGLVGERGPEFISGPATITNQRDFITSFVRQTQEQLQKDSRSRTNIPGFDLAALNRFKTDAFTTSSGINSEKIKEGTENVVETFTKTDKTVKSFDKELSDFVKSDSIGKMNKQLSLVTDSFKDLNELVDPNLPTGLQIGDMSTQPPTATAASTIASTVISRISGMLRAASSGGGSGVSGSSSSSVGSIAGTSGGSAGAGGGGAGGTSGAAETTAPGASSGASTVPTAMPSSTSGGDAETQQGMEVKIGNEIRKGGTVSWRTNNPGNISYGELAKRYGAIGRWIKPDGDLQQRTTGIAIFPTIEHGDNLKMALWRRPLYIDRTIDEGVMKWTGTVPSGSGYAKDLARAANASLGTRIRDLSDQQLRSMTEKQKVWEGFREGQVAKASAGGLFSGPSTGYPVEMHGNELVTRLNPNSLLEKLAKTPAQQIEQEMMPNKGSSILNKTDDSMKELASINTAMMEMLADKLDNMINRLDTSNETQEKLLKFSQV